MTRTVIAFAMLFLMAATAANASPDSEVRKAVEKAPLAVGFDQKTKPVALTRMGFGVSRTTVVGHISGCMWNGGSDITYTGAGSNDAEYANIFSQELRAAHFAAAGDRSALFDEARSASAAEYQVGALVKEVQTKLCHATFVADDSTERDLTYRGNLFMKVEWQIYSPLERKVIYRTETEGWATVPASRPVNTVLDKLMLAAFGFASRNLLADQGFFDLVTGANAVEPPTTVAAGAGPLFTIKTLPLEKRRFQDHVSDVRSNVVTVFAGDGTGSGFFVSEGYIFTNAHVVQNAKFVKVKLITGREIVGEVMGTNARRDVAIVKTEPTGLNGLPLRTSDSGIGSQIYVIGSPLDARNDGTVLAGIISTYRELNGLSYIQSDVAVQHGNSGGPMVDENGNVIGIVQGGQPNEAGAPASVNFFIPIAEALKSLGVSTVSN